MSENGEKSIENGVETPQGATIGGQIQAPSFGFDEKGIFHLEVDSKLGFLNILGTLQRAISFVNGAMNQHEAKIREKTKLSKPTNMLGKFNLFR